MLIQQSKLKTIATIVVLVFISPELEAQVPALRMTPSRIPAAQNANGPQANPVPGAMNPAQQVKPRLKDEEVGLLKKDYDQLSPEDREAMVATSKISVSIC